MFILPAAIPQATVAHTFTLKPDRPVQRVNLAGTFNGWNRDATPMALAGDGKTYRVTLKLSPGKYQYKFVLDGDTWIVDPKAPNQPDGNGNTNSILLIVPADYAQPAKAGDGMVALSALQHSTEVPYFNYDRGRLSVSLRVRPDDLSSIAVQVGGKTIPLEERSRDEFYARYAANIPWDRKKDLSYVFVLKDGSKTFQFGSDGLKPGSGGRPFRVSKAYKPFVVPRWVEDAVFYQIFPDRFANGNPKNDPANVMPWDGKPQYFNRFGGDIAGVQQHLDHLSKLGINAVYFNPIFQSPSNHRYDTTDYFKVDPEFGTNEEFTILTHQLTSRGIRTVLDGVFNHTAVDFRQFADIREKGEASAFTKWYTIRSYPVKVQDPPNYVAWYNFPSMPKVNLDNPETRDYFLTIPKVWDRQAQISGWRLDVANEVSMDYWRAFRKAVKAIDPNNWIVGEEWGDASAWLKGDQWDSAMNYRFRGSVLGFVTPTGDGKPSTLLNSLFSVYDSYAPQVSRNMLNMISSHDTPRIKTLCGEDESLAKLAAIIQFTWVGAPSIYYGEELGMSGGADPDNRRGMEWNRATDDNEMLQFYRKLVAIRRKSALLRSGDPVRLLADDKKGVAAYGRKLGDQMAVVAVNRSDTPQEVKLKIPVPEIPFLYDQLSRQALMVTAQGHVTVSLAPRSAAILLPERKSEKERERERERERRWKERRKA